MGSGARPFTIGMALWALALIALLAGVQVPALDRQLAIGTCIAALILGNIGFWYMRRRAGNPGADRREP